MQATQNSIAGNIQPARIVSAVPIVGATSVTTHPSKKQRKERGPNWDAKEILALIDAKRRLQESEELHVDKRHAMQPDSNKWHRISVDVNRTSGSSTPRDGPQCKSKWNQLIPDYKRIVDHFSPTGTNNITYWTMGKDEKKAEGLPRSYPEDVFNCIHEWFSSRPSIRPPHTRDLLAADDGNYVSATGGSEAPNDEYDFCDDSGDGGAGFTGTEDSDSTRSRQPCSDNFATAAGGSLSMSSPRATPARPPRAPLPFGVVPILISSSDTTSEGSSQRPGNTGVRRKALSGHSLLAEATRATGTEMTNQMREIAESTRDMERAKIDVQFKLFTEQMQYYRDRDMSLNDNAREVNENAKLAIQKQGQMVQCLSHLSHVLSAGLLNRYPTDRQGVRLPCMAGASPHPTGGQSVFRPPADSPVVQSPPTTSDEVADNIDISRASAEKAPE